MVAINLDFDNFGLRGGSKSGKKWHTEWFDEIETSFNRFVVIINIGIDTQQGMVALNWEFDHFGSPKVVKSGKSGTHDGLMNLKPFLIDFSSSKTYNSIPNMIC